MTSDGEEVCQAGCFSRGSVLAGSLHYISAQVKLVLSPGRGLSRLRGCRQFGAPPLRWSVNRLLIPAVQFLTSTAHRAVSWSTRGFPDDFINSRALRLCHAP